ncbi:toxin RelE [Bacteroidia bacterium]|nr:toxin RelE [Bacteroidia bacterium]
MKNYEVITTEDFDKKVKPLAKKYRSFLNDLANFKKELLENPEMGDDLGDNTRKVRMAIASKNKGKSGGARVITCQILVDVENAEIYLLTIYDKGEQDSISKKEIDKLKRDNGLL